MLSVGYWLTEQAMHAAGETLSQQRIDTPCMAIIAASDQNVPPQVTARLGEFAHVVVVPGDHFIGGSNVVAEHAEGSFLPEVRAFVRGATSHTSRADDKS